MADWHCHKCKVATEEKEVEMIYMDMPGFPPAQVCPNCNAKWMLKQTVYGQIVPGEEELEAKLE